MAPSGDLFADAERCQWEAKLVLGDNTLSGSFGKLRKFGLVMREDFSVVSLSIRDKTSRGVSTTAWMKGFDGERKKPVLNEAGLE